MSRNVQQIAAQQLARLNKVYIYPVEAPKCNNCHRPATHLVSNYYRCNLCMTHLLKLAITMRSNIEGGDS